MSSSTSSQWMPIPPPINRQWRRCLGVARARRGNHSRGADTIRPSASVTTKESRVNATSTASLICILLMVLVPGMNELITIILDQLPECRELMAPKTSRLRQCNRLQPELRVFLRALDVNMPRLISFSTKEKESETSYPPHFWHGKRLSRCSNFFKPQNELRKTFPMSRSSMSVIPEAPSRLRGCVYRTFQLPAMALRN